MDALSYAAANEPCTKMPLRMELEECFLVGRIYKDCAPDGAGKGSSLAQVTDPKCLFGSPTELEERAGMARCYRHGAPLELEGGFGANRVAVACL